MKELIKDLKKQALAIVAIAFIVTIAILTCKFTVVMWQLIM